MNTRNRITQILLWLAVIGCSIWVGGTLYQMLVIVPLWSASPPESVRAFFLGTRYNETIWNFGGPATACFLIENLPLAQLSPGR